jgi:hypothetical protein
MSLPIFVRPVRPTDSKEYLEWVKDQPGWDAYIALQPRTFTLAAYNKNKTIMYLPIQQPYILETAAINPEASELEVASAFKELVQSLVTLSHSNGVSEIYFLETDSGTSEFAGNHVFEKLPYAVYRVRVSDLEPHKEG